MKTEMPMQPMVLQEGRAFFRANRLVNFLLREARADRQCDLSRILEEAREKEWPADEIEQFWQLMGYSVSAYGELSFIRSSTVKKTDAAAAELEDR